MKKFAQIFLAAGMTALTAALILAACSKEGADLFRGNWSFKTSGTLTIERVYTPSDTPGTGTDTDTGTDTPGIDIPDIDLPNIDIPDINIPGLGNDSDDNTTGNTTDSTVSDGTDSNDTNSGTDGTDTGTDTDTDTTTEPTVLTPVTIQLPTESGQMDILATDKDRGKMLITMNILLGDAYLMHATAEGRAITIEPFTRIFDIQISDLVTIQMPIEISGTGRRYDDTIVLDLSYTGTCNHLNTDYTISESNITCIAKLNDY